MAGGGNDIDSLKFSLVLDSKKFESEMKRIEGLTAKFEKSVKESLAITNLLEVAQNKGSKATEKKVKAQKEIVLLTRQELEAKKAAGTITDKELKQLNDIIKVDKAILEEEKKQYDLRKKQLDIEGKELSNAQRRKLLEKETGEVIGLNTQKLMLQSNVLKGLGSYVAQYASLFGAVSIVRNMVRITGEFEAQHTALRAILQDTAAADRIFNQLQVLAVKSPFTFQNLTSYAKQLTAFSIPVNEVFETTKKLADVSAGLGVDMGRIILAYGQVRSAEFLRGQEVRQFTEAGIPILKELAQQFQEIEGHAISVGEVFERISAREVPFSMVEEAFNRMTSAGGKFYQMQEVLAETVKGKVSNLQDAWEIMLSKIGNENSGTIKGIITGITNLLANYEKWIGLVGAIIKYLGLYNGLLLIHNTLLKAKNAYTTLQNSLEIIRNKNLTWGNVLFGTQNALEKVHLKNQKEELRLTAAITAARKGLFAILSMLATVIWVLIERSRKLSEEANKHINIVNDAMAKLNATLIDFEIGANRVESAFIKMKEATGDATEETKAFYKSVDDLKKQFPKFVDDNMKLATTVDELGQYWARARMEMNQYYADEARESAHNDLQQNRDESVKNLSRGFSKYVTNLFKNKSEGKTYATMAWRYVLGDIDRSEMGPMVAKMSAAFGEKTGNKLDYSNEILRILDEYVDKYRAIMRDYEDALNETDDMLAAHEMSTTRRTFNEALFSLLGYDKQGWSFDKGETYTSYGDLTKEQQDQVFDWFIKSSGLGFLSEDGVDQFADRLREKFAAEGTSDKIKTAIEELFKQFPKQLGVLSNKKTGWQADVDKVIDDFGETIRKALKEMGTMEDSAIDEFVEAHKNHGNSYRVEMTDDLSDMISEWTKGLNKAQTDLNAMPSQYANLQNSVYANYWLNQLLLQAISTGLYGTPDFGGSTAAAEAERRRQEQERRERQQRYRERIRQKISDINQNFQNLKELKAAYDQFKSLGFDDAAIDGLLTNYFGTGIPKNGFASAFEALAVEMDKYDKHAAEDIRNFAAGKDWRAYASSIEAAQKATSKFKESLEDLGAATKRLNLEGFAADLDKVLVDTDAKNRRLRTDWEQKLNELAEAKDGWIADYKIKNPTADDEAANAAWVAFYTEQKDAIDTLLKTQTNYNNKVAQRQIDKMADEWVRTMLEEKNIDLSNLNLRTIQEIETLKTRLEELKAELPDMIPPEVQEDADNLGVSFDTLLKLIEQILNTKIDDLVDNEELKKVKQLAKDLKSVGSYLGKIGSAISKFGGDWEGIGDALSDAGSSISSMADIYEKVSTGAMSKGAGTASYIMIAIENIVSVTARAIENFKEMKEAAKEWELELQQADYEFENLYLSHFGYKQANVFGVESPYAKALAATEQMRKAQEKLLAQTQKMAGIQVKTGQKKAQDWGDTAKTVLEMTAAGAAVGAAAGGGVFSWATTLIGAAVGLVAGGIVAAFTSKKMVDVFESLGSLTGGKIFDPKTLELTDEVLARYNQMDEAGKAIIDHWKEIKEVMREALDTFNENVEDVVGDIGQSIKDMLIDAFNNGDVYGAIDDLHDYIGNTIQSLMMEIAFAKTLQPLFDELEKNMRHSFGIDAEGNPMTSFDSAVDYDWIDDLVKFNVGLEKALPAWNDAMEGATAALEMLGYTWNAGDETSAKSLGNGIKSITEDTANLLASYLNAIRADVSYGKTQWERIAVAVEGQAGRYITLNDYLQQVAANTFDTAQNTQAMLQRFDGFIRDFSMPSGLGESIKVQLVN